jgi:hypothetical protein
MNGGAAVPRLKIDAPNRPALLRKALFLPTAAAGKSGLAQTGAMLRDRSSSLPCRAGAAAGSIAPVGSRPCVSPHFAALSRFAEISAAAIFAGNCSQNRRALICLILPRDGRVDSGWRPVLLAGRRRFSPIKFFLTKNPLPSAIDLDRTRLWAPSLPVISPCVQLAALDFRVSNRPWAQVK